MLYPLGLGQEFKPPKHTWVQNPSACLMSDLQATILHFYASI